MAPGGRNKIVRQRRAPRESLEFVPPAKQRCLRSANEKHSEVTSQTINRLGCYQKKRKTRSLATEKQAPHLENICLSAQGVVIGSRLSGNGNEWKFKALPEKKELRLCCRDLPQQDMMAEQENEIPPVGSVMDPGRAQHLDKSDSTSDETMSRLHLSDADPEVEIVELCKELSKEHKDMMQVLFSRKLKLEAALTFWKRHPEDLVSYLFRVHDLCVVADCVGIVTKRFVKYSPTRILAFSWFACRRVCIKGQTTLNDCFIESDELLSLGACVDLLPLIHALLKSRYENHNLTALDWLTVVIKHWWATISNDDHQNELHFSASNVSTMRDWLQKMMDQVRKLSVIPGRTGKSAKVCHLAFRQLHSQWAGVKHQ